MALPTDTVYGFGVRADDEAAVRRLYLLKGRPEDNPLPVLLPDAEALLSAASAVSPGALSLARRFWPGALTLVVPKSPAVSDHVTRGRPTVGLRVPDHPVALALLRQCEFLVAVTSANLSGCPPATRADEILHDFPSGLDVVVDAGPCPGGVPSSVVDASADGPVLLRAGAVPWEEIVAAWEIPGPSDPSGLPQ